MCERSFRWNVASQGLWRKGFLGENPSQNVDTAEQGIETRDKTKQFALRFKGAMESR